MQKTIFCVVLVFLIGVYAEGIKLTKEQLEEYDGRNGKVYFACGGVIFDATDQKSFHEGGRDSVFAGKDATVALARMDDSGKWVGKNVDEADLSPYMKNSIERWVERLTQKFPIVGELVSNQVKEDL